MNEFYKELETHRKPPSDDPYDNKITHCYLVYTKKPDEFHFFEVRGWGKIKDEEIGVSAVNWTLCAGTCSVTITDKNCNDFDIISWKEHNDLLDTLEYVREPKRWYYKQKEKE